MMRCLFLAAAANVVAAAPRQPTYVIHVLADDLGYNDVAFRNGQSITPSIDKLHQEGIEIPEFYVYKMCAPSRATIMSGRYPMHLGMYNNNGLQEGVLPSFTLLPGLLKLANWSTHALGKWHVGWFNSSYLPTARGFDTFFGSSGNTADYWEHTISGPKYQCTTPQGGDAGRVWRDFIDCTGPCHQEDVASNVFGEYDARVLTERAMDIVKNHDVSRGLYIYLAFHNVHNPAEAPCETVAKFGRTADDRRKVIDASLLELDYGIANLTELLSSRGMLRRTFWIFHTDNGGPTSHACNYPLRGGKFTFWEGGVRGVALVSGGLIPSHLRGTRFQGLAHLSDWYPTIAEGLAGIELPRNTGPVAMDGVNLWPAMSSGSESPRTEVLHLPLPNKFVNTTLNSNGNACTGGGCSPSIRVGDYKLIIGWPGTDVLCHLTPLLDEPIPYGRSKGVINGSRCSGGNWDGGFTHQNATCVPFCLFNVKEDVSESHDLSASHRPVHIAALKTLQDRLTEISKTGVPIPEDYDSTTFKKMVKPKRCAIAEETGFWLPIDWLSPSPPSPVCEAACAKGCHLDEFSDVDSCVACTRDSEAIAHACTPKERHGYCNGAGATAMV